MNVNTSHIYTSILKIAAGATISFTAVLGGLTAVEYFAGPAASGSTGWDSASGPGTGWDSTDGPGTGWDSTDGPGTGWD